MVNIERHDNALNEAELKQLEEATKEWWAKMQYVTPDYLTPQQMIIAGFRQGWRVRHAQWKKQYNVK